MHEHLEILIASITRALHRDHEPRRRRPRTARATYVPRRRDRAVPARFAH